MLIERGCQNDKWVENSPCNRFRCPPEFIQEGASCFYISEPTTYNNGCPHDPRSLLHYSRHEMNFVWIPKRRKLKYWKFEWDVIGRNYGLVDDDDEDEMKESGDCVVEEGDVQKYVNCTELYSHMCMYEEKKFFQRFDAFSEGYMELSLRFNARQTKMYLTIFSPEYLMTVDDDDAVYCFTNAGKELKTRVDADKIYDSRKIQYQERKFRNYTVYDVKLEQYSGQYWCEAFYSNKKSPVVTPRVVGYKVDYGNEFSVRLVIKLDGECTIRYVYTIVNNICQNHHVYCRIMDIFNFHKRHNEADILIHLSTNERTTVINEFHKLKNIFNVSEYSVRVIYFRSSEYCLSEETSLGTTLLHWKMTRLSTTAMPRELCVREDGYLLTRNCSGDFLYGAMWANFKGNCSEHVQLPERTKLLYNIISTNVTEDDLKNMAIITEDSYRLSSIDISFLSSGLHQLSQLDYTSNVLDYFLKSIDNIMRTKADVLKMSQSILNSTDVILDAIDEFLERGIEISVNLFNGNEMNLYSMKNSNNTHLNDKDFGDEHVRTLNSVNIQNRVNVQGSNLNKPYFEDLTVIVKPNVIVHITKPFSNNITGLALYGNSSVNFTDFKVIHISKDETFENLDVENLELAMYVPRGILRYLTVNSTNSSQLDVVIITTVFYNGSLFNENSSRQIGSRVIGVSIPGFGSYLPSPLPLLFRATDNYSQEDCMFWEYGESSSDHKGRWSTLGKNYMEKRNDFLVHCAFSHLTHFGLLIMNEEHTVTEGEGVYRNITFYEHDLELTIITLVGSVLSLTGLLGIFATAFIFKKWREKIGTKILLQLSITIALEIIIIQVAGLDNWNNNRAACTFIGICLHYVVLSKFYWMLVIAFLQYLRYVKVLGGNPSRILLKSSIIGWALPIIPVVLTITIFPKTYGVGTQKKLCYPKGVPLYIFLIGPIVAIMIANIGIFLLIMYNISKSKALKYDITGKLQRQQAYLGILLFFTLGIPWVFGILAEVLPATWIEISFMYLFCLTATLQGLVLFVFYVVLDRDTRRMYIERLFR